MTFLLRFFCFALVSGSGLMYPGSFAPASAAEAPPNPILRIETGTHTASINRIALDAANRYLVTASYDKTVRVWSYPSGELIRILRVPIDVSKEGALYAVAISPDGGQISTAGWTGEWDDAWTVYIFETATGRLIRRLTDLPHRIIHLAYSKDGRYLAVTMKAGNGLRVYRTSDFSLAARDGDYGAEGDDATWVEFDAGGRLVTASLRGKVRLYDSEFRRIAEIPGRNGKMPVSASFSPDGSRIAVGYGDSTEIDVFSGADLSYLFSPDNKGLDNGVLNRVTWSADGEYLYATGWYEKGGRVPVVRWEDEGRGRRREKAAANKMLMHLQPLKDGGVAFGGNDPVFGTFDATHRLSLNRRPAIADFQDLGEDFLVSEDGGVVYFGFERWGGNAARFSIGKRSLERDPPPPGEDFVAPVTDAPGLAVEDWKDGFTPKLNGKPLALRHHEMSLSLAIAPGAESFLLGTRWRLRHFDGKGTELWNVIESAQVFAVNVVQNGKVAVAALGDGTIRWYRMADGRELLALFPHKDGARWVAWTPSGYYMASVGGDTLIGWHVNRGKDAAADFFSVARFRDIYYRPDVVGRVLAALDEDAAVKAADAQAGRGGERREVAEILPPVVSIEAPAGPVDAADARLILNFSLRSSSGEPAQRLLVMADGRPIAEIRGDIEAARESSPHSLEVEVPAQARGVTIIAKNRFGVASEPATLNLMRPGAPPGAKPKLYILAVGISAYQAPSLRLAFAAKDAEDFVRAAKAQKGGLYGEIEARILIDSGATREDIKEGLAWIEQAPSSGDVAMIFLAGHGVDNAKGYYYYLPHEADPKRVSETALPYDAIRDTLSRIAGKTFFFIDTCHAGRVWGRAGEPSTDVNRVVNDLSSPEFGVVVFASSMDQQLSLESQSWGNGAFTKALVEGIDGAADILDKRYITVTMLDVYVSERVYDLTMGKQTPTSRKPMTIPSGFRIALPRSVLLGTR